MNQTASHTRPGEETSSTATRHGSCEWHGHHRAWRHHRRHHVDTSQLSDPQRLAHRERGVVAGLVFLTVRITLLALFAATTVVAWRWVFDVFSRPIRAPRQPTTAP